MKLVLSLAFAALLIGNILVISVQMAQATHEVDELGNPVDHPIIEETTTAQPPQPFERGKDFERHNFANGTSKLILGVPIWTKNSQGEYVPHVLNVINSTRVQVQSGLISWDIGNYESSIYGADFTDLRAKEKWVVTIGGVTFDVLKKFFLSQTVIENSTGVFVTNTMKDLMQYFHLEDYDGLLRYAITLGVSLMPKK